MKRNYHIYLTVLLFFVFNTLKAQGVEEFLIDNNKLNAVITILSIILVGLFGLLFYIERKVKKLEENQ